MIQGKLLSYGDDLSEVYLIRKKVFIDELGMTEDFIKNENDKNALHVIIYEETDEKNNVVAAGSLYYNVDNCLLDKVAVLKEYRNMKYGDFAVRMLIFKAFQKGYSNIELKCKKSIQRFFETIGFDTINVEKDEANMIITEKNVCKGCQKHIKV